MCDFISWIEKDEKVYFLNANQIFNTTRGKALQKYCGRTDDYTGHGTIRKYYSIEGGVDKECTDFSTPDNFPPPIVSAIKRGMMRGLGTPEQLLTVAALAEYKKVEQPARAEYKKVEQPAWAEYKKVRQTALAEYKKVEQAAWAEYEKVEQAAFWDLFDVPENRNPLWR